MSPERKLDASDSSNNELPRVVKQRLCERIEYAKVTWEDIDGSASSSSLKSGPNIVKQVDGSLNSQYTKPHVGGGAVSTDTLMQDVSKFLRQTKE